MRNIRSRMALFFNIRGSAALDRLEDPREVLDYAYGQQQYQLRTVRRGLLEVAAASAAKDAAQDLFWGQLATLWARWAVILGGALLVLSRATTTEQLALGILPVVALLVLNFYLHGRYLLERPANAAFTLLAAALDLLLLGLLFVTWGEGGLWRAIPACC